MAPYIQQHSNCGSSRTGTYHPRFASVNHLNSHPALGVDLCKLSIDVIADELGDFGQSEVGHQSNGELAYRKGKKKQPRVSS